MMDKFSDRVYRLAGKIPEGKVATYGQIALLLGHPGAARAVGTAMAGTPSAMDIPCHRVISSTGKLAPSFVFGGAEKQRALLMKEGVCFLNNGRVDLAKSLWRPDNIVD